jgi:SAM-dependent methyltransferase
MMAILPFELDQFTFVDLGSGKGRTLLLASQYPFRKIVGVELIEELHRVAEKNIREYQDAEQRCRQIESVLGDARAYEFPLEPTVLYLFNPFPERALVEVLDRLGKSLAEFPRAIWIVYHNPLLESVLGSFNFLERAGGTQQYALYRTTHFSPGKVK